MPDERWFMVERNKLEIFNVAVARTLAHLLSTHPTPFHFDTDGLKQAFPELDESDRKIYADTVDWLGQEGFIARDVRYVNVGNTSGRIYGRATLTLQGMALLGKSMPSSIELPDSHPNTIGQEIINSLKTGAIDVAKTLVKELILMAAKDFIGLK
jgi:hypothetical protein